MINDKPGTTVGGLKDGHCPHRPPRKLKPGQSAVPVTRVVMTMPMQHKHDHSVNSYDFVQRVSHRGSARKAL